MSEKTIQQQIDEIIENQFNGYRGDRFAPLKPLHEIIRQSTSDYMFLAFLEKQERDNPKPIYKPPKL